MRLPEEPEDQMQINIVPMIDVIFAILTFFIMSTLFLTRSEGLPVNLPQAGSVQSQPQGQIVVTITQEGQLSVNRQSVRLPDLTNQVEALLEANPESIVVINADEQVPHGQVVTVMDRLRSLPGVRLAIAAKRPS
ncbi:biopolymer transporter ExbD [Geitlerinema sp. PCC 7407]|uniref:ExbD/TolR family protein n=1 Tax=Geitlerinema sp. PCC 7407 TaxID=1173025 RepID=UPI00029FAF6C|nr:biopolymer transporter ExbD [Geitlerinema sp. PCC 7407]AFY65372.1 outer membrane transport energization protein ExbD [Geitlerinema sp. PCC 7407]